MPMLSDDDLNLRELSDAELALAWDLWFDLAQVTNDADPPYSHGVFQLVRSETGEQSEEAAPVRDLDRPIDPPR
jgi:hypothetical protein